MKTVWKYHIPVAEEFELEMPVGADMLSVQVQQGEPQLWALVNPDNDIAVYRFYLAVTGHAIHCNNNQYIGSFQIWDGRFVGHLFLIQAITNPVKDVAEKG